MDHSVPRMYIWFQNGDLRRYIYGRSFGGTMALVVTALVRSGAPPFSRLMEGSNLGVLDYALGPFPGCWEPACCYSDDVLWRWSWPWDSSGRLLRLYSRLYSAPDLALTQLVIELLMVVLLVLGISKMLKVFNVSASSPRSGPPVDLLRCLRNHGDVTAADGAGDAPAPFDSALLSGKQRGAGQGEKRSQHHSGGLSRLRHPRRDYSGRNGCPGRFRHGSRREGGTLG